MGLALTVALELGANPPPPIQDVEERLAKLKGTQASSADREGAESFNPKSSLPVVSVTHM